MSQAPICNEAAERSVLRAWVSDREFRQSWKPEPELFYSPEHRAIAACMAQHADAKRFGETVLLGELERSGKLTKFGREAILAAVQGPVVVDPWRDVERIRELAAIRSIKGALSDTLANMGPTSRISEIQEAVREADTRSQDSMGVKLITSGELALAVDEHVSSQEPVDYCTTINRGVDAVTGGIRAGDGWLFVSRTSWGKSTYTAAVLDENTVRDKRVLLVTSEDRPDIYARRIACRRARVRYSRLRDRRLNQDEELRVARSLHDIAKKPWWTIDARGQKAERVFGQIRAAIKVHRIDLVMVDYVQAMRLGHHGMRGVDRIGEIGRALTDTIKSQDGVALWMVSQSTPEKGREDDVYSARGNKDLAVEAEVVLIGEWYERAARGEGRHRKIICGKVKEGPAGREFEAPWDDDSANFVADVDQQLTLDMEEY